MDTKPTRCIDCKHFRYAGVDLACQALMWPSVETSPIDGKTRTITRGNEHAELMRKAGGHCGPEARLFVRRVTLTDRIGTFLRRLLTGVGL